ncbi:hypothetical protein GW17_00027856 [Ensete ventricosum]|uniref:Uncharacterized protein n=1 Tax=Ensete ventricosum TaxID=4639 RepID=A0A444EE77_ENSVE|nr:hypothetical protein B296_00030409 [Ensete ventricosum]RWW08687.1 hypothetical protein GW17_00027856 [Ensete ventricosum]RZR99780.1 hypothetical protein BHM03_00029397 [Ensete ventricosum]
MRVGRGEEPRRRRRKRRLGSSVPCRVVLGLLFASFTHVGSHTAVPNRHASRETTRQIRLPIVVVSLQQPCSDLNHEHSSHHRPENQRSFLDRVSVTSIWLVLHGDWRLRKRVGMNEELQRQPLMGVCFLHAFQKGE